ncbi:hypothetical protein M3Y99_01761900 [Aphelenchoides fujianensis]|nr:hypothetical protein M3Y99_01761900 [Aphelenchoides fujianensis]
MLLGLPDGDHRKSDRLLGVRQLVQLTSMTVENFLVTTAPQKARHSTNHWAARPVAGSGRFFGPPAARSGQWLSLQRTIDLRVVQIFANAQRVFLFESRSRNGQAIQIRIFKCVDGMPTNLLFWSTGMNFVIGYFVPFALIAVFNGLLFVRLSVLYVSYVDLFESRTIKTLSNGSEQAMVFLYCAHILPYLNASLNWLLYARLARDLASQFPPAVHRNGLHEAPSFTHNLADNPAVGRELGGEAAERGERLCDLASRPAVPAKQVYFVEYYKQQE